jgi:hypothetical protein
MAAPTLISYTETAAWNTSGNVDLGLGTTAKTSGSVSWQSGDVVAIIAGAESATGTTAWALTNTGSGLAFGSPQKSTPANNSSIAGAYVWAAVASAGSSGTFTVDFKSTVVNCGFAIWVFRSSAGIGNSAEQHTGGSTAAETVSLTPMGADSAIVWGCFDWNAPAVGSLVPTPTHSRQVLNDPGAYTLYVGDITDQPSTSGVLYGCNSPNSNVGPFSIVVLEVKAGTSAGDTFAEQLNYSMRIQ